MPSSFAPDTETPSSTVPRTPSTVIPFSPPTTATFFDRDVVRADDDAAADDRPRLADQDLLPRDHERALVNACVEVDDRRPPGVGGRTRTRKRDPDGKRSDAAEASELATVLCVAEPQPAGTRLAEQLREQPASGEERERLPERRAITSRTRIRKSRTPSSSRPSGTAIQPGW